MCMPRSCKSSHLYKLSILTDDCNNYLTLISSFLLFFNAEQVFLIEGVIFNEL